MPRLTIGHNFTQEGNHMRIHYNAPVILTFAIIMILVFFASIEFVPGITGSFFALRPTFSVGEPLDYFRLFSHVIGHASTEHLFNNLTFILLLGPILEEKYGSKNMIWILAITALATGIINVLFSSKGLLGSSSIVFAFIILASIVNVQRNSLPLSFVIVAVLFIGNEFIQSFEEDMISQTAHIVGGVVGAVLGFRIYNRSRLF